MLIDRFFRFDETPDDRVTRSIKIVIVLVSAFGGLGVLANYVSFAATNNWGTLLDAFVLLIAPAVVIVAAPLLAKRSTDIRRTANLIFLAIYLVIVLNTVHKGSAIGTAAYFMLAFSVCYSLLFGWRGMLIAGLVSLAHFTIFLSLADQLSASYTLVARHAHVIDMEAITGTLSNYALVFLIGGSCAAAFNTQITRAVAELSLARQQADEANAAKSDFLANMGHDIRTPMNAVLGMAQVLKLENLKPHQQEMVDLVLDSGTTLTALLDDLLDLSKIQAGKLRMNYDANDLASGIRNALKLFEPRAREKGLELELNIAPDFPESVVCEPVRVRQCVSNLISNAIKFTNAGKIVVSASMIDTGADGKDVVEISVTDTGIGIDEETQSRLFGNFEQASAATAQQYGGTGLGLSISRNLARLMGGDLTVSSTPGAGSTFTLTFAAQRPGVEGAAAGAIENPGRPWRVLLVDDNAANRRVVRSLLAVMECEIVEAANGLRALEVLAREPFDIVLMDIRMPVMDGEEAFRRIREAEAPWRSLPVIALTAQTSGGSREKCIGLGMNGHIAKPVDAGDLISQVRSALGVAA